MVTEFALEILLKIIKLARSTYYYHLKQLDQTDNNQTIKAEIQAIFTEHKGNYGYRRITLTLRNRGFVVNHKKVQRLMKVLGLIARIRRKRKYSSYRGDIGKKADNLIQRQFKGSKPMEKCYTDVTEFTTAILEEAEVALVTGAGFGAPENVRLSYATDLDTLKEAVRRLKAFMEK